MIVVVVVVCYDGLMGLLSMKSSMITHSNFFRGHQFSLLKFLGGVVVRGTMMNELALLNFCVIRFTKKN